MKRFLILAPAVVAMLGATQPLHAGPIRNLIVRFQERRAQRQAQSCATCQEPALSQFRPLQAISETVQSIRPANWNGRFQLQSCPGGVCPPK